MIEIILGIYLVYTLFKLIISNLQIFHIRKKLNDKPLFLDKKDYQKAGNYAIINEQMSIIGSFIEAIMLVFWLFIGLAFLDIE